jgi:hypothetical protein
MTSSRPIPARAAWVAFAITLALILGATLIPTGGAPPGSGLRILCIRCGNYWVEDDLVNVLLFVPFGAFLALAGVRPSRATMAAALTSISIEVAQFFFVSGRDATVSDAVTNTTGGFIGAWLALPVLAALLAEGPAARRHLRQMGGAIVVFTLLATWLLLPPHAVPPLHVQIEPNREGAERANLDATGATLDGQPVEVGHVPGEAAWAARFNAGQARAGVSLRNAGQPGWRTILFRVASPEDADPLTIAVGPRGWLGAVALRAEDYGLNGAALLLTRDRGTASPVTLRLERDGPHLALREVTEAGTRATTVRLNPALVWIPFFPFRTELTGDFHLMTLGWVAAVGFILGWWSGRSGARMSALDAGAAVVLAWTLPLALGFAPPPRWCFGVVLAVGVVGALVGPRMRIHLKPSSPH